MTAPEEGWGELGRRFGMSAEEAEVALTQMAQSMASVTVALRAWANRVDPAGFRQTELETRRVRLRQTGVARRVAARARSHQRGYPSVAHLNPKRGRRRSR